MMLDFADVSVSKNAMNDPDHLRGFVQAVLDATGMVAWGLPMIERMIADPDKGIPSTISGTTIVQLLHTSNIVLHMCDETSTGYFDLFSCREFDVEAVKGVVDRWFGPARTNVTYVTRRAS